MFHRGFCLTQMKAQELALAFNAALEQLPGVDHTVPRVQFLDCSVYMVEDDVHGRFGVLVEKRLDPTLYRKWNNNAGYVPPPPPPGTAAAAARDDAPGKIDPADVPQAFTHFTYRYTGKKMMVCDLQGVLDTARLPPLYELTDPAIHYKSRTGRRNVYGRSDLGSGGMDRFLQTHQCSALCGMLKRHVKAELKGHRSKAEGAGYCADGAPVEGHGASVPRGAVGCGA